MSPKVHSTVPWMASESTVHRPAGMTLQAVGTACIQIAQREEIPATMSGRESVRSLWSVGGVPGFEVRNVLNIKGFECSAKKAVPLPVEPGEGRE